MVERYRDLPLGLVDVAVIASAEMLGETNVATLDRRHIQVVRPTRTPSLKLLP